MNNDMELKNLKKNLEKTGYKIIFFNDEEVKAGREGDSDADLGISTLREVFTIKISQGKLILEYQFHQIDRIKSFDSEKEAFEFIKKKYPIV
jgi:hypothetical protein